MNPNPKTKAYRDKKYLEFIRGKLSLFSGEFGIKYDPIVAAHQGFGRKGTALKPPDSYAVPLRHTEHQVSHQVGEKTFWGSQYEALPLRCLEFLTEYLQSLKEE